ncbi:MAG: addiction module protein, partial [Planctomycetes bacterium]|nr:addiction module protein [Planctomycetota bacterium]
MTTFHDVLGAAQDHPSADRARLIGALWETLEPDAWSPPTDQWLAEVRRRSAAYDEGQETASEPSEVRQRARREAGLDGMHSAT